MMWKTAAFVLLLAQVYLPTATTVPHISNSYKRHSEYVTIFGTGGTIASKGATNTQTPNYKVGVTIDALVEAVPELCNISNVSGRQVSERGQWIYQLHYLIEPCSLHPCRRG
jgi:L-asparaginase